MKDYTYCHGFASGINRCLKCPYPDCVLDARKNQLAMHPELRPMRERDCVIVREVSRLNGKSYKTYFYSGYAARFNCGKNIKKAKHFTFEEAVEMVETLPKKWNYTYKITKRSDELEKIEKNN